MNFWDKPYYLFRPRQLVRRLYRRRADAHGEKKVILPWGLSLWIHSDEMIGVTIWLNGVFDLTVTETLWRLLEAGDIAVDAGANIGYMTSLMAVRVGPEGHVHAFEPHPGNFESLQKNVMAWREHRPVQVTTWSRALSDREGKMELWLPADFWRNRGLASLDWNVAAGATENLQVSVGSLDQSGIDSIGVLKVDVEGHELAVFRGGQQLLQKGRIRDIIFESHQGYPTLVTDYLESFGYSVFLIYRDWKGLRIKPAEPARGEGADEAFSLLATREPGRAQQRLASWGWQSLRGKGQVF